MKKSYNTQFIAKAAKFLAIPLASMILISCNSGTTNTVIASSNSLKYETIFNIEQLRKSQYGAAVAPILNATYSVNYIYNSDSRVGLGVAIESNAILTVAHNFAQNLNVKDMQLIPVDELNQSHFYLESLFPQANESSIEIKVNIRNIVTIPGVDLAIVYFENSPELPLDSLKSDKLWRNQAQLAQDNAYGSVFALGWTSDLTASAYTTKLTGKSNFEYRQLKDAFNNNMQYLLAATMLPDSGQHQIDAVRGDSGGPWILCNSQSKDCGVVAIQSFRHDFNSIPPDERYRSVSVPLSYLP